MIEEILKYLELAGVAISLFAVAVILVGFGLAAGRYARRWGNLTLADDFARFRVDLGHALMLGLELLVLADVLETITVWIRARTTLPGPG